jgi:5-methylcytosine-specific restriction endonuclease McrA
MRSIDITGKRNIDKIRNVKNPERKETIKWKLDDSYFTYNKQIQIINSLYLNQGCDQNQDQNILAKREISKKINGYKSQDIQKELLDLNRLISLDQTIEKLMVSKLKCFYCKEICELLYKNTLAKKQWTLDRLNNEYGHNYDNVVICCLECNIKKGEMDSDRFKQGKEIKIIRKLV